MMPAYYNEHDRYAAQWLRNLIAAGHLPPGEVDERDIRDVQPDDVRGFTQQHYFAGVGGWAYALRLAGLPDDLSVVTGSCPCQPFSCAGKQAGTSDERHLWPAFFRLIRELRPATVFGEQVPGAIAHGWLDLISDDLESEGYAVGAVVLPACSVSAPHLRQRLWWVANAERHGRETGITGDGRGEARSGCSSGEVADRRSAVGFPFQPGLERQPWHGDDRNQLRRYHAEPHGPTSTAGESHPWADCVWLPCLDGKSRPVESVPLAVAARLPGELGLVRVGDRAIFAPLIQKGKNRVMRLKGYGNAIVPQVAAEFIRAYMDVRA